MINADSNYGLSVDCAGDGSLLVTNGWSVYNAAFAYIGYDANATGEVLVNGNNSALTNSGYMRVGHLGIGTLDETVGVGGNTYIGMSSGIGHLGIYESTSFFIGNDDVYVEANDIVTGGVAAIYEVQSGTSFILTNAVLQQVQS